MILDEKILDTCLQEIRETIERRIFGRIVTSSPTSTIIWNALPQQEMNLKSQYLLENFKARFEAYDGDLEAQHDLIGLIVERVYGEW